MGNLTQLHQGSLNGLRRQTNECLDAAYNKGYEDGAKKQDEVQYQKGYNKGFEDGKKCLSDSELERIWENELGKAKLVAYKDGFEHGKLWAIEENTKNYDNGYNNALEDVNHAIDVLKDMTIAEAEKWFGEDCGGIDDVVCGFTIQRIIDTIKAYEEKKQAEKESIKVGDEVLYGSSKLLVTKITNASICTVNADGKVDTWRATAELIKTGRHFNEVSQLLDNLKGE